MDVPTIEAAIRDVGGDPRKCSGVYQISNTLNGKVYVGGSVNIRTRLMGHFRSLRRGSHHSQKLQRAWEKYGEETFSVSVLEKVSPEGVEQSEQKWLDRLRPHTTGYNICPKGRIRIGIPHTPETRAKISRAMSGRKLSESHVEQIRERMRGHVHSPDALRRITDAATGKKHTAETKKKIGAAHRGKTVSAETRRKISEAHQGNKYWEGRTHSEESRQKMSTAQRERWEKGGNTIRERVRQRSLEAWSQDDGTRREAARAKMVSQWEDPDFRNKVSEAVRKTHTGKVTSAETRRKMSESQKRRWARRKAQNASES